ncbi:MAG: DUF1801 domain-containing protein [Flavobacteriaceae bacterium]
MRSDAKTVAAYLAELPENRREAMSRLRDAIKESLPAGFKEMISYGMIGYVVPHEIYPSGYHCNPSLPLPFLNIASQKNYIAVYHAGIYASKEILDWFTAEYPRHSEGKLDMGKSCIRFKKTESIPYELISKLCSKITVEEWINLYESQIKR